MSDKLNQLTGKLKELFQLNRPDLDFGFYRIMHAKQSEIEQFLDKDLLPQVKDGLAALGSGKQEAIKAEIDDAIKQAEDLGVDKPEETKKVKELRAQYGSEFSPAQAEDEIYSHLYNFFARYYQDGDFMSMRRYKEGVYAIPYEGEEVYLHWANKDQYYIKTSENLKNYTFKLDDGRKVTFRILEADTEKDNKKAADDKDRRFILTPESISKSDDGQVLVMGFEYRVDEKKRSQSALNEDCVKDIQSAARDLGEFASGLLSLRPTDKRKDRTLLEKHLEDYTAKHTFDYFIHKDLGKFLKRELDFYIKNEVMHLDDIEHESAQRVEQYLTKVKVIRKIASKIIDFLAQLENFQKKLWLKKKFVVETNYCITLDRVPEELYPEIAKNDAQWEEWEKLGFVDLSVKGTKKKAGELELGDDSTPPVKTVEYLNSFPPLLIDTKFFDNSFREALLASIEDFEKECDGVLIHSDNFQALNLLAYRYRKNVKCVYVDPPYNTGKDGFVYKDGYQSSSWISLLDATTEKAKALLADDGLMFISNDDNENDRLKNLLIQNSLVFKTNLIWNTDGHTDNQFEVKVNHEYVTLVQKSSRASYGSVIDPNTREESNLWQNVAENSITKNGSANPFSEVILPIGFPVAGKDGTIAEDVPSESYFTELGGLSYYPRKLNKKYSVRFPIKFNSARYTGGKLTQPLRVSAGWANLKKLLKFIDNGCVPYQDEGGVLEFHLSEKGTIYYKKAKDASRNIVSVLRNFETTEKMKYELEHMDVEFSYPKPKDLIAYILRIGDSDLYLDYFAGSGTTAHAVISMNRSDAGARKYILAEMGEYFDTVLKPRIQKVIYSSEWKDGTPSDPRSGVSHCFKYIRLESYEDCLNNLLLSRSEAQDELLIQHDDLREDYMLNYMLDVESKGSIINIDAFEDPFAYKMKIATGTVGETKPVNIDLVETFNYLIGLKVKHIDTIRGVRVITGENLAGERILVLWRKTKKLDSNGLDEWFKKQGYNTQDMEFDLIYVNGDNNLENLKKDEQTWKVRLIEEEFQRLMFEEVE